jgi:hypothetical protein
MIDSAVINSTQHQLPILSWPQTKIANTETPVGTVGRKRDRGTMKTMAGQQSVPTTCQMHPCGIRNESNHCFLIATVQFIFRMLIVLGIPLDMLPDKNNVSAELSRVLCQMGNRNCTAEQIAIQPLRLLLPPIFHSGEQCARECYNQLLALLPLLQEKLSHQLSERRTTECGICAPTENIIPYKSYLTSCYNWEGFSMCLQTHMNNQGGPESDVTPIPEGHKCDQGHPTIRMRYKGSLRLPAGLVVDAVKQTTEAPDSHRFDLQVPDELVVDNVECKSCMSDTTETECAGCRSKRNQPMTTRSLKLELKAFICHHGKFSHYSCFAKNSKGEWYEANDGSVKMVDKKTVDNRSRTGGVKFFYAEKEVIDVSGGVSDVTDDDVSGGVIDVTDDDVSGGVIDVTGDDVSGGVIDDRDVVINIIIDD